MNSRFNARTGKPYSEIDEKIKPIVEAMNATGVIKTIASCQGHANGMPPYVYFKASVDTASAIEQLLRGAACADDPRFLHMWVVEGRFNENFELVFLLYCPVYHDMQYSLRALIFFGTFRRRLDAELLLLVGIVEQAVFSNIGDKHKPYISTYPNDNGNPN
jgi:hypothetical protein